VLWVALFLDLASPLLQRRLDDEAVYRVALGRYAPSYGALRGIQFRNCFADFFPARPPHDRYRVANVLPSLPPLPGHPGGPVVRLSSIIWNGPFASLELIDDRKGAYCLSYRKTGSSFEEYRNPAHSGVGVW
jgi:hypothetical protein